MFGRALAATFLVASLATTPVYGAPVEPQHNGFVLKGAELTGPCQDDKWPWNAATGNSYTETNRWVVFVHDRSRNGFTYESDPHTNDDWMIHGVQPRAAGNNNDHPDLDPGDCWRRAYDPTNVDARADAGPRVHYDALRWRTNPGYDVYKDPTVDQPLIADEVGRWRMEVWREVAQYVYDDNTGCTPPSSSNRDCWIWPVDGNGEDLRPVVDRLERRDFEVSETGATITAGPSGTVGEDSAIFGFGVVYSSQEKPPGHFECRIVELGGFEQCEEGAEYAGLVDGAHEFQVRYVQDGQDPETAVVASRKWTSDTTPPTAQITSAPSGTVHTRQATISFTSTEPDGTTFRCSRDGGPEISCSSPHKLLELADGAHSFGVRAIDKVGNEQSGLTQASWTVAEPPVGGGGGVTGTPQPPAGPPKTTGCPGGGVASFSKGAVFFVGRSGTCFSESRKDGTTSYTASGPVTLNGIQMTPATDSRIVVEVTKLNIDVLFTGPVTLGFAEREFAFTLERTLFSISAGAAVAKLSLAGIQKLIDKSKLKLAGLPVTGAPTFELSDDDGGTAKFGLKVQLPSGFSAVEAGPANRKPGAVSFEVAGVASNEKAVRVSGKGSIARVFLGPLELKGLQLAADEGPPLTFEASVEAGLGKSGKLGLSIGVGARPPGAFPDVTKLSIQASEIQKPLAYGIFLQRLGAEASRCSSGATDLPNFQMAANGGLSLGPKVEVNPLFEGEAVSLDGNITLKFCDVFAVEAKGAAKIVDFPVADMKVAYAKQRADLTAALTLKLLGYGIGMTGKGFVDMSRDLTWAFEGTAVQSFGVFGSKRVDAVLSNTGMAVCAGDPGQRFGIGRVWAQGKTTTMGGSCDLGPYRAKATLAQAGGQHTLELAPGRRSSVSSPEARRARHG